MDDKAEQFLGKILPRANSALESMRGGRASVEELLPTGPYPEKLEGPVHRAAEKIAAGRELDGAEQFALEAIIIPDKRPAIDILNGDYEVHHNDWLSLNEPAAKRTIRGAIPSVGRIELPGHPRLPYGGTGFVVGTHLIMTNRHVAEIFSPGLGSRNLVFRPGQRVGIDFDRERDGGSQFLEVRGIAMIHPYWDMALLRVEGLAQSIVPLRLSTLDPDQLRGRDVAVIGYPAFDPRNDAAVQNLVFRGVYDVKRLMPGKLTGRGSVFSYGKDVPSATHDGSTLGGASGSAVVDVATGDIVALHFAGLYLKTNYAVPTADLARDARVVDQGVNFVGGAAQGPGPWVDWWRRADGVESRVAPPPLPPAGPATAQSVAVAGGGARWTVPIEISITIGTPEPVAADAATSAGGPAPAAAEPTEKAVEPIHEEDYDNRAGYDPDFLGVAVPLPEVTDLDVVARLETREYVIPYHHFSVVMHRERRLALYTAANVDAAPEAKRPEPGRDYTRDGLGGLGKNDRERWFTDPRLRGLDQLPDRFFEKDNKAFDKGHLVRRDDVAWGRSFEEVRAANGDTYHTTNCSPQVAGFNRSNHDDNWGALEDLVLKQAKCQRLAVFAGPVLSESDRRFIGVDERSQVRIQIPEEYWKLVVAVDEAEVRSFAFVLKQDLNATPLEFAVPPDWQHSMVSVAELEEKLGGSLRFPDVVRESDQKGKDPGEAVQATLS